ncbi:hypothetical protein MMC25_002143 [Agyrium rufum]|nr:hypothetical protein [Agyrium rufum]
MSSLKKVSLIGAPGRIGKPFLTALIPLFEVTALTRKASNAIFPSGVKLIEISEGYPVIEVVKAFQGQDAVIFALGKAALLHKSTIIKAASKAGIKRLIP